MLKLRNISVVMALFVGVLLLSTPTESNAGLLHRCKTTCCEPCCDPCPPPPPPVKKEICLKDPCTCCTYKVCVCVPCCCEGDPCVSWRKGLLGRKVATLSWKCCGHCVKVVVKRNGCVKVRG